MPAGPAPTIATRSFAGRSGSCPSVWTRSASHRTRLWLWGHKATLCPVLGPHVPELRALELLVVVSRTGSLSAAAAELGITQQAASSRVRTMESLVGTPLLDRSRRGSALTPTGELLVQWAGGVLEAAEQLDAGIAALRADRRGHLSIAASLTIAEHLLPGWLVALRARQAQLGQVPTDVTMTATNSERVATLVAAGDVDLGFVEGPDAPEDLQHRLVGTDTLVGSRRPGPPVGPALGPSGHRRDPGRDAARRPRARVRHPHRPGPRARRAGHRATGPRALEYGGRPVRRRRRRRSGRPRRARDPRRPGDRTAGPHQRRRPRPHPSAARGVARWRPPARGPGAGPGRLGGRLQATQPRRSKN